MLALALRVWFVLSMREHPLFEPLLPGYDMTVFQQWATRIAEGNLSFGRAFYQAPLYPYLLGALYALAGPSELAAKLFQAVLGSLSVLVTYLLGSRLFSRRAGLFAAILTAVTPIFPFYEFFLLRETLVTFLCLAFLLALFSFNSQRPVRTAAVAGVLLGLSALTRSNALALWPLAVAWVWLEGGNRKDGIKAIATLTLVMAVIISPATIHNRLAGGEWVLVATNFDENWKIGNSLDSNGGFCYPEKELARVFSADFLKLQAKKAKMLLSDYEQPNNVNFYQMQPDNPWLGLGTVLCWGLYLAFGLAGIWLTRGKWRQLFPLYGYLVFYGGTLVLFFITSRFRVPLWPVLILFSAAGLETAAAKWQEGKKLEPLLGLGLAVILACGLIAANPRTIEFRYRENQAEICEHRQDWAGAEQQMRAALADYPDNQQAVWKMAYYLQKLGRPDEASTFIERLLVMTGDRPDVLREAGYLDLIVGRKMRGVERLRRYLVASPGAADSSAVAEIIARHEMDINQ